MKFWTKFSILLIAGIMGTIAGLPYIFDLQKDLLAQAPLPILALAGITLLQTAVMLAITIFVGLRLAIKIGITTPLLDYWLKLTSARPSYSNLLKSALGYGALAAALVFLSDSLLSSLGVSVEFSGGIPSIWKTIPASLYGGIVEELLMRLFIVSLIAWLLAKLLNTGKATESSGIMIASIVAAAVLFGLGHLPATAALTDITPAIIARAILLNGIAGIIFGWLYWKKGLEYAVAAHIAADIFLLAVLARL